MDDDDRFELPETQIRALTLLDDILYRLRPKDPDLLRALSLLRHQLQVDEKQFEEAQSSLQEFEEAYTKLTSPANRIGTFLGSADGDEDVAQIALGDGEFLANHDPKVDVSTFKVGTRVKVNDAYAVLGDLGYHPAGPIVKVQDVLGDGRLRISTDAQGLQTRVVMRSPDLESVALKQGDEVRMEPNGRVALEHFPSTEARDYYLDDVPEIPWSAVGGQEEAIALIRDTIELPLLHPDLFERFSKKPLKGVLLYGPPGCGKTLIGKATAYNLTQEYAKHTQREVKHYFMFISGPKILNMWLGESERMVREIFAQAREKAAEGYLVFIFIDEAESLLRTRSSGRWMNISNTIVPQFAAEMDGLVKLENVVVMLTSNRPDYIDPAILRPERIDRKVKVGRPNRAASREILSIYLTTTVPLDPDLLARHDGDADTARASLLDDAMEYLYGRNEETEFLEVYLRNGSVETLYWKDLLSGALLKSVVDRAKDSAIRRSIDRKSDTEGISLEDMTKAIKLEFKENEIFPKSDTQDDWLKLIDYEPDHVASVRPIRNRKPIALSRNII
ncbi:MAG TPA: AAA family ATPase [Armatimonadota bacterium]|jgi:proteasome-associated ATPase